MDLNENIEKLYSFDTEYCADSVEWCPHEPNQNVFVCGNYQLTEDKPANGTSSKRLGRILLFSISPRHGLKLHETIDTAAILDQKWCYNKINGDSVLAVVNAEKKIVIYRLHSKNLRLEFICDFTVDSDESETLILSLDWSTAILKSEHPKIVCSDSKGKVHLLNFGNNKLSLEFTCHGHDYEAWIAGFYYWDPNIFFSGGDDSILLKFDRRVGLDPISKNKKHEAGVTSFHSNYSKEFVIATGSYDEQIRIWDIRSMKTETNSLKMPGTLWRLKWDPFTQNYLLAACMLGGVHVVDVTSHQKIDIVASFLDHKKIAYGADWCYMREDDCIMGTCSFYDHLLCVSKVKLNKGLVT